MVKVYRPLPDGTMILCGSDGRGKKKKSGKSGLHKVDKARKHGRFVTIDSEGQNYGPQFEFGEVIKKPLPSFIPCKPNGDTFHATERKYKTQQHRTFLWGAGDEQKQVWLQRPAGCNSIDILHWLCTLPVEFPDAIFISFVFSYDATQILKDFPYEKAWEISKGKPWGSTKRSNSKRWVLFDEFAISYMKGKEFKVALLKDRNKPFLDKHKLNADRIVRIFDVFGFFQASFSRSLEDFPGALTEAEKKIIAEGKANRPNFTSDNMEQIKCYTAAELTGCSRMMNLLRDAMQSLGISLAQWYGAGSIASALLKKNNITEHCWSVEGEVSKMPPFQLAAHHAYFGARIEMFKQGFVKTPLFSYDISSAYPYIATQLPSMKNGLWVHHKNPTRGMIQGMSILSMIRLRTDDAAPDLRFHALPYRTDKAQIYYQSPTHGWYMQDEVSAAIDYWDSLGSRAPQIVEYFEAWEFVVRSHEKPFDFIPRLFEERVQIIKADKKDIKGKVIKLGLNSVYGKLAQAVGESVPKNACPWYAAAITAGTRAQLLRAITKDPEAIIMVATDGIDAIRELDIECSTEKKLGVWERTVIEGGGLYIKSGIYLTQEKAGGPYAIKSRGIRPTNSVRGLEEFLLTEVPKIWTKQQGILHLPYQQYLSLGAALASRERFLMIGNWLRSMRELDVNSAGAKRTHIMKMAERKARIGSMVSNRPSADHFGAIQRAKGNARLGDRFPVIELSAMHSPDWLDDLACDIFEGDVINGEIAAKHS